MERVADVADETRDAWLVAHAREIFWDMPEVSIAAIGKSSGKTILVETMRRVVELAERGLGKGAAPGKKDPAADFFIALAEGRVVLVNEDYQWRVVMQKKQEGKDG